MTVVYLIVYGRDPTDRFAVHRFADRRSALAARLSPSVPVDGFGQIREDLEERPGIGGCSHVIETVEDARNLAGPLQVMIYRSLTGNAPNRFESRAVGADRLIEALASTVPAIDHGPEGDNAMPENVTAPRGRKPRFSLDQRVTVNLERGSANPLKEGKKNAEMLETIRGLADRNMNTTVRAIREAGVPFGHLDFYAKKGYVTIENYQPLAQAAE